MWQNVVRKVMAQKGLSFASDDDDDDDDDEYGR
jgi:hypothetical protein